MQRIVEMKQMTVRCQRCGTVFSGTNTMGPCPNCGWQGIRQIIDTSQNYSGTVVMTGSSYSAFEAVAYAKNMVASMVSSDPTRGGFMTPIVTELDKVEKIIQQQQTELARAKKGDWTEYGKKIAEYRDMVTKGLGEPEFQTFFEKNAAFLDSKVTKTIPKFTLAGELIPDFLLILHDSSYLFVEIEKPCVRLFDAKGKPTAPFTQAQQQVRDQLKWVEDNKTFLRDRDCPNLTGDNYRGLLVVGRSSDLSPEEAGKLRNINAEVRGKYEIKTFDRILEENETMFTNIRKYTDP